MKAQTVSKIVNYLTGCGLILWISAFFLDNWIRDWFFPSSWGATVTLFILPVLGALVLMLSMFYKKLWTGLLAILFIISFPLSFGLGYFIFGP